MSKEEINKTTRINKHNKKSIFYKDKIVVLLTEEIKEQLVKIKKNLKISVSMGLKINLEFIFINIKIKKPIKKNLLIPRLIKKYKNLESIMIFLYTTKSKLDAAASSVKVVSNFVSLLIKDIEKYNTCLGKKNKDKIMLFLYTTPKENYNLLDQIKMMVKLDPILEKIFILTVVVPKGSTINNLLFFFQLNSIKYPKNKEKMVLLKENFMFTNKVFLRKILSGLRAEVFKVKVVSNFMALLIKDIKNIVKQKSNINYEF